MTDILTRNDKKDVLGDIGGVIADALEVPGDEHQLERRRNRSRIMRHYVD